MSISPHLTTCLMYTGTSRGHFSRPFCQHSSAGYDTTTIVLIFTIILNIVSILNLKNTAWNPGRSSLYMEGARRHLTSITSILCHKSLQYQRPNVCSFLSVMVHTFRVPKVVISKRSSNKTLWDLCIFRNKYKYLNITRFPILKTLDLYKRFVLNSRVRKALLAVSNLSLQNQLSCSWPPHCIWSVTIVRCELTVAISQG